jgi:hypothetical protein
MAMENHPFIDVFSIKTYILDHFGGFPIAMLAMPSR